MVLSRARSHDRNQSVASSKTQKKKQLLDNIDEHDGGLLIFPDLIIAQSKESFGKHSRELAGLLGSGSTFGNSEVIFFENTLSMGQQKGLCSLHWELDGTDRHIVQYKRNILENEGCMTYHEETLIGHTRARISTLPLRIAVTARAWVQSLNVWASCSFSHQLNLYNLSASI